MEVIALITLLLFISACGVYNKHKKQDNNPSVAPVTFHSIVLKNEIEVSIPETWKDKCKITEDNNQVIFSYQLSSEREIELFKIMFWSLEEYKNIRKLEGDSFNEAYIIGQNEKHVYYFIAPIDIDLTEEELKKYANVVPSIYGHINDIFKNIKILK
jgi:hypothetical protein